MDLEAESPPPWILNAAGVPEQAKSWGAWFNWLIDNKGPTTPIVVEEVSPNVYVSTVFVGMCLCGAHSDHMFETRVLGGRFNGRTSNYGTRGEALAGHAAMVSMVMG